MNGGLYMPSGRSTSYYQSEMWEALCENIEVGLPVVLMIKIYENENYEPFSYSLSGSNTHMVVATGAYIENNIKHVIILDPHPNTAQNTQTNQAYCYLDITFDSLYTIATRNSKAVIRCLHDFS